MPRERGGVGLPIDMRPLAYRIELAAEAVGISKSKMYELASKGAIRTRRIEGATVILRSDLEAFVASLPEGGRAAEG